jgi:cold shock CspA family protein/ribosome-associated translation inhibitor RaiA
MNVPLSINFKGLEKSEALETLVRSKAEKLEKLCSYLSSCSVSIERIQEHQRNGQPFRVRIDMTVPPGHELSVTRAESEGEMHTALTTGIRNAFKAAEQQLRKLKGKQIGRVKNHPQQVVDAVIVEINREEGWGYLQTTDDRKLYFHEHSVLHGGIERLAIGTGVSFSEELGEKGPQATSVRIIEKRPSI